MLLPIFFKAFIILNFIFFVLNIVALFNFKRKVYATRTKKNVKFKVLYNYEQITEFIVFSIFPLINIGYLIYKSREYKSSYDSVVKELRIIEYYA